MITISDIDGRKHYLHPDAIARISEAGASSAWHGIRSIVHMFDCRLIEARELPTDLAQQIATCRKDMGIE